MSLSADDDGVGIPRVLVSRHSLQGSDPDDLIARATIPGRAGGYAHLAAGTRGRAFTVETSATSHALLKRSVHANHYLDGSLARPGHASAGSRARLARVEALLEERQPATVPDAMELLADHDSEPQAVCVHPDPADGEEATATVFAMVCHLEERRMWVAAGTPCTAPYQEIDLQGVA
jgi:isopenicillin-N N-acyltransferase-like protein